MEGRPSRSVAECRAVHTRARAIQGEETWRLSTQPLRIEPMKQSIAVTAFALFASVVFAHGDKPHAAKAADYFKAEETPFGRAADPRKAKRTIKVEMNDQMRFVPAEIMVKRGETVRFVPSNKDRKSTRLNS